MIVQPNLRSHVLPPGAQNFIVRRYEMMIDTERRIGRWWYAVATASLAVNVLLILTMLMGVS